MMKHEKSPQKNRVSHIWQGKGSQICTLSTDWQGKIFDTNISSYTYPTVSIPHSPSPCPRRLPEVCLVVSFAVLMVLACLWLLLVIKTTKKSLKFKSLNIFNFLCQKSFLLRDSLLLFSIFGVFGTFASKRSRNLSLK